MAAGRGAQGIEIPFACLDGCHDGGEFTLQLGRLDAFGCVQIGIARAHCQAVGLAQGVARHDVDRQVELPNQFLNHPQLLEVLFSKHGHVWLHQIEQLQHDRRHASEMTGAEGAAQVPRQRGGGLHGEILRDRIEFGGIRREHQVATGGGELLAIGCQGARITLVVFTGAELQRVDEDARDHWPAVLRRQVDQRHVAGVQVAHGGDEGGAGFAGERGAQLGDRVDDLHQNVWSAVGTAPSLTAETYARAAASMPSAPARKFFENFGARGYSPSMSYSTSTWPEQSVPAPMPMVGIASASVTALASAAGTISSTMSPAPAASSARASAISWAAAASSRPCTR